MFRTPKQVQILSGALIIMEEEFKEMLKIAREGLEIQKRMEEKTDKMLDLTEGMHKVMREMNVRIIGKLANI